ncbi:hypothetical protein ACFOY2_52655 [Nonomuraea purpurea]|uniref:Uncharacterized protein n=1 Tax=Nonomuraea purpurea TaxID=1849276 RepID=A0ABV8GPM0_9ACTN
MRSLKTLVVALLATIAMFATPALAQAAPATSAAAAPVGKIVVAAGKPKPGEICKRFKSSWKKYAVCWAVMKAGGVYVWGQLESIARKGWTHFKNHPTVKRYAKKHARSLYCMLTLKC